MMWFQHTQFEMVPDSLTVEILCAKCFNQVDAVLVSAPHGFGVGIPFTRFVAYSGRTYAMGCPICKEFYEIDKNEAEGLML